VNCADVAGVLPGDGPLVLEINDCCTKICLSYVDDEKEYRI
jgi:hypothetical protein